MYKLGAVMPALWVLETEKEIYTLRCGHSTLIVEKNLERNQPQTWLAKF